MSIRLKIVLLLFTVFPVITFAQGDIEDLLSEEVENWNPVYKPVIGVGVGAFNYLGDVRNPNIMPFNGTLGYKVNVATFLDNNHFFRVNFTFLYGSLTGSERKVVLNNEGVVDLSRNLNFKSDIMSFGINLNYDFDHFYKSFKKLHPFISVGIETFTFDSRIDSFAGNIPYNYWSDGSIRTLPENGIATTPLLPRDYIYETPLRNSVDWGQGKNYPQYGFAVPIDVGLDFQVTDRVMFRIAGSYHHTFTDLIDHVSSKNDPNIPGAVIGDKRSDDFLYTYFSLHLDLFSSDQTISWDKMFVDLGEFDNTLMGDEDADGRFDGYDECPNTPFGVEVDTSGCPLDDDYDGIPNYMDDEPNSRYGAYVDERGVELSEDDLIKRLDMSKAVSREDVALFVRTPSSYSNYHRTSSTEIPDKFKHIDLNEDSYISFDEMMKAIDTFFDFNSQLNSDDIYELNDFFFTQ